MTEPVRPRSISLFLGLAQMKGIGFKTMRELGGPLGVAARELDGTLLPALSATTGMEPRILKRTAMMAGVTMRRRLRESGVEVISQADERYPIAFRRLNPELQPLWLFCRGDLSLLQRPSIAVVGTRDPSSEGAFLTQYAARTLQELEVPLVSGLALGVDAIAHESALSSGVPNISVLGTGILRPYPARNVWMADAIVDAGGLLLSEYFPEAEPNGEQFVWRNRLQAALSACVVAPQWKKSSGTAHTMRFAKSFGKPTINLVPNGMRMSGDHGVSEHLFTVPKQHSDFLSFMRSSLNHWPEAFRTEPVNPEPLAEQHSLFG
ncbi:DNA-processing protein DprA [Stenotrophomonas maltophilia]|uniref:DNA-processing protein DprA n=2 Tax=Stenotrophomonas maltophilia TaxID=40324 RepID=UPI000C153CA7